MNNVQDKMKAYYAKFGYFSEPFKLEEADLEWRHWPQVEPRTIGVGAYAIVRKSDAKLVYVGYTTDCQARMRTYRRIHSLLQYDILWCATGTTTVLAQAIEAYLIITESPLGNIRGAGKQSRSFANFFLPNHLQVPNRSPTRWERISQ